MARRWPCVGMAAAPVLCVTLAGADPALLALMPRGAPLVGGFDAERLAGSGFGKRLLARLPGAAEYRDLAARAAEVVFTTSGVAGTGMLAVARGKFVAAPILSMARSRGETIGEYRGVTTIAARDGTVALLSETTIAIGDEKSVQGAIDRRQSTAEAALVARARELSARHHGWLVLTGSPALAMAELTDNRTVSGALRGDLFQAVESMEMGFRGGAAALEVAGQAVAKTEKDAALLAEALKFLTQLLPDISGTEIRAEGATVRFTGKAPARFVEKLLELSGAK